MSLQINSLDEVLEQLRSGDASTRVMLTDQGAIAAAGVILEHDADAAREFGTASALARYLRAEASAAPRLLASTPPLEQSLSIDDRLVATGMFGDCSVTLAEVEHGLDRGLQCVHEAVHDDPDALAARVLRSDESAREEFHADASWLAAYLRNHRALETGPSTVASPYSLNELRELCASTKRDTEGARP